MHNSPNSHSNTSKPSIIIEQTIAGQEIERLREINRVSICFEQRSKDIETQISKFFEDYKAHPGLQINPAFALELCRKIQPLKEECERIRNHLRKLNEDCKKDSIEVGSKLLTNDEPNASASPAAPGPR